MLEVASEFAFERLIRLDSELDTAALPEDSLDVPLLFDSLPQ